MDVPKSELERRIDTEGIIRLGRDYQVENIPVKSENYDEPIQGKCLWDPENEKLTEDPIALEKYLAKCRDLKWPEYPALTLLSAVNYEYQTALEYLNDLEFVSPPDRWTSEERRLFLSTFSLYGKNFEKIHCWLKEKEMKELVEFYYHLKAKKQIISPGFQQEKTLAANTDSKLKRCAEKVNQYENIYDIGELQKDIEKSCEYIRTDNSAQLKVQYLEEQIVETQIEIQKKKEAYTKARDENESALSSFREKRGKKNSKQIFRWEDQEIYYFSMALKEFGKDYNYISKIMETKQPAQLEKFYNENCEKFLLNAAYQEYLDAQKIVTPSTSEPIASITTVTSEPTITEDLPCEIEMIDD